jgi:uncharacterized protein YdeI (YjbR/CyaY-like superfamily)
VDEYLNLSKRWQTEMVQLRIILLSCPLVETLKWRQPCYMFEQQNLIILGAFKAFCVLNFFKGALLQDAHGLLKKPGEHTQAGRWMQFASVNEIIEHKGIIQSYVYEAIEIEKAGLKITLKKNSDYPLPGELEKKWNELPAFKRAFEALTPGRQRAYLLYFSAAKQPQTRESRIEKYLPQILNGKGINDCTCGHSKKFPYCDGSHKLIGISK